MGLKSIGILDPTFTNDIIQKILLFSLISTILGLETKTIESQSVEMIVTDSLLDVLLKTANNNQSNNYINTTNLIKSKTKNKKI